jgi:hypothetical protein
MWQAAGLKRRWPEFEDLIEMQGFTTTTIVSLGLPLIALLAPQVQEFLQDEVVGNNGFAQRMGPEHTAVSEPNAVQAVPHCREIELQIATFDPVTGESSDCIMDLLLHTRGDANRSRVKITTELESARHNELVEALVRRLATKPAA